MMQLFTLGPAFGLPSIDAPCIAAVALLQLCVPCNHDIVPTHDDDDYDDESRPLPRLLDGSVRVSGFGDIAQHLVDKRLLHDRRLLNATQRTDATALAAFIEHHAPPLLDIALYVSAENYRRATRPAYSAFLPAHANYTVPPVRRNAARRRTEHLGIASIDVDTVHEDMSGRLEGFDGVGREYTFEAATQQRASLLLGGGGGKQTLRPLLQTPERAAVFKLNTLADNFFEPLQDILGDKAHLLSTDAPTAIDCLLVGYLSLMLFPKLPQDWLADTLRRKYQPLVAFTERLCDQLTLATNVDQVLSLAECQTRSEACELRKAHKITLPWSSRPKASLTQTLRTLGGGFLAQLCIFGQPHRLQLWNAKWHPFWYRNFRALVLATAASFATVSFLSVHVGLLEWPRGDAVQIFGRKRISNFGHIGAALAGVSYLYP